MVESNFRTNFRLKRMEHSWHMDRTTEESITSAISVIDALLQQNTNHEINSDSPLGMQLGRLTSRLIELETRRQQDLTDCAQNFNETSRSAGKSHKQLQDVSQIVHSVAHETTHLKEAAGSTKELVSSTHDQATLAITTLNTIAAQVATTRRRAVDMEQQLDDAASHAERLEEALQGVGRVVTAIEEIAGQTNLLALNAAIEAARAGELGKGFAVVASEVKDLAQHTSRSTRDIEEKISEIAVSAGEIVKAVREASDSAVQTRTEADAIEQGTSNIEQELTLLKNIQSKISSAFSEQSQTVDLVHSQTSSLDSEISQVRKTFSQIILSLQNGCEKLVTLMGEQHKIVSLPHHRDTLANAHAASMSILRELKASVNHRD